MGSLLLGTDVGFANSQLVCHLWWGIMSRYNMNTSVLNAIPDIEM